MAKATEVAMELRKFAEALDKGGDVEIQKPMIFMSHYGEESKGPFLALAKLLPRPVKKGEDYGKTKIELSYTSAGLEVYASIPKELTCELVEAARPAVYRCEPILSREEEEGVGEAVDDKRR